MNYLSLFSGIEATSVAWHPLGWEPVGFSEVNPFCNALLAHKYPDVPNLGDITTITEHDMKALGNFDLIVFGSPCQDLSVAGKRKGLDGTQSSLFRSALRLIRSAAEYNHCRYALWENVPGVFSSQQGADFSEVLRLFTGASQPVPQKGWQTSGVAYGPQGLCEWRVLDAQYCGVPQRRRRVFAFLDLTEQPHQQPVLFERESVRRDFKTGREKKEAIAGTLESRTTAGGFPGPDGACANHVIPAAYDMEAFGQYGTGKTSSTLKTRDYKDATDLVVMPIHDQATRSIGKRADKQDGKGNDYLRDGAIEQCPTLRSGSNGGVINPVCFQQNQRNDRSVRRLTPLECERLQGLPDHWTKIPYRNKPAEQCPDTPRYRAIGNSMAVPVMHWIGERIEVCCA